MITLPDIYTLRIAAAEQLGEALAVIKPLVLLQPEGAEALARLAAPIRSLEICNTLEREILAASTTPTPTLP